MMLNKVKPQCSMQFLKAVVWTILLSSVFYCELANAAISGVPTLDQALSNLKDNIPSLMQLVTSFAYISGLWCYRV
jgi:hypothetical protein